MANTLCRFSKYAVIWAAALLPLVTATAGSADSVIINSLGMTFVPIPSGRFMMGSPDSEPHRNLSERQLAVTISGGFYLQTTEVTLGQWRAVMGEGIIGRRKGADNQPVVNVSWFDAQEFIKKLNLRGEGRYRLPTEAEWEYAARAGSNTAYAWGQDIDCSRAMFSNNPLKSEDCVAAVQSKGLPVGQPAPVGQYPPNAWGLYDMAGNVWEWVADWYGPYDPNANIDPAGPRTGEMRIKRGGSWFKYGYYCRSANRNAGSPATRLRTTGFRLIRADSPN